MKIRRKGMLIVLLPLASGLIFIASLYFLLIQSEIASQKAARAKEIAFSVNRLNDLFLQAITAAFSYCFMNSDVYLKSFNQAKQDASQVLKRLDELLVNDSLKREPFEHMKVVEEHGLKLLESAIEVSRVEGLGKATLLLPGVRQELQSTFRELVSVKGQILKSDSTINYDSPKSAVDIKQLILLAAAANVMLGIYLANFVNTNISKRIETLIDNTEKASRDLPLAQPVSGTDEIASLDQSFRTMVAQRNEFEKFKHELIAMVTHDLRAPLTSLMFSLQSMEKGVYGPLNEEGHRQVAHSESEIERLISLINGLLDIEQMRAGKLVLQKEVVVLDAVIARSIAAVAHLARHRQIQIESNSKNVEAFADGAKLLQVLVNLLSNAIKFSPENSTVTVSATELADCIKVTVQDQGQGIPDKDIEKIFQPFEQLESGRAAETTGSGLGLAICKNIVDAHGGAIGCEKTTEGGSCFWFTIPVSVS